MKGGTVVYMNGFVGRLKRMGWGFLIGFTVIAAFTLFGVLTEGPTTQGFINTLKNGMYGGVGYGLVAFILNPGKAKKAEENEEPVSSGEMVFSEGDSFENEPAVDVTDVDVEKYQDQ